MFPSTFDCPTGATVTLHGQGFLTYPNRSQFRLSVSIPGYGDTPLWTTRTSTPPTDTALTFAFTDALSDWPLLLHTVFSHSQAQPIWFESGNRSSTVLISFATLSPFNVTDVSGCAQSSSQASLTNCLPGVDEVILSGSWLIAPMVLTIGPFTKGEEWLKMDSRLFDRMTPYIWGAALPSTPYAVKGQPYYLRVARPDGQAVQLPNSIYLTEAPVVSYIRPCVDGASHWQVGTVQTNRGWFRLNCQPGDVLTMTGLHFSGVAVAANSAVVMYPNGAAAKFNCTDVQVVDDRTVTCRLPSTPITSLQVTTSWAAQLVLNPTVIAPTIRYVQVYDYPNAVRIRDASCQGQHSQPGSLPGGLTLRCKAGVNLTLQVEWLGGGGGGAVGGVTVREVQDWYLTRLEWADPAWRGFRQAWECGGVTVAGEGKGMRVDCQLPGEREVSEVLAVQQVFPFVLQQVNGTQELRSNALYLTLESGGGKEGMASDLSVATTE